MTYSRLARLLEKHQWLEEEDARRLLVAKYYFLTSVEKMRNTPEIQAAMEEYTNELIVTDPDDLRGVVNFANRNQ